MRYLRKYNEARDFVTTSPLKSDIQDILLELGDVGFENFITIYKEGRNEYCKVEISKENKFNYEDVEDVVERLKDYMTENNFYVDYFQCIKGIDGDKKPVITVSLNRQYNRGGNGRWTEKWYSHEINFKKIPTNEELKSDTYKSAADKLAKMGHVKRPEELMKWHAVAKDREKEQVKRKTIEEASKLGIHKITLTHRGDKFTGDFYVYFYWENDNFDENYNDWRTFDNTSVWIQLSFAVIPASEESKEYTINFLNKEIGVGTDDKCWIGQIGLNLTQGGNTYDEESNKETFEFKPNGSYYQEDWHGVDWNMADRASAQKFKKMLYDVLSGEILWRESEKVPGGIKEQLIEELCNERGHDLSEYIDFVESIKKIRVNQLYKD